MGRKSIIYLADSTLLFLEGQATAKALTVTKAVRGAVPEGALINGLVTDQAALGEALAALCRTAGVKSAQLVVDSGQVMAKSLAVPKLTKKELLNVTRSELQELDAAGRDLVYDYAETGARENGGKTVLCCAADREQLHQYEELAQAAGCKLTGITTALACCVRMARYVPALAEGGVIVCALDGQSEVTYLFSHGEYVMSSRARLVEPRGTTAIIGALMDRVSSMLQFSQTQKSAEPAKSVWFAGLEEAEAAGCKVLGDTLNVQAAPLPDSGAVRFAGGVTETLAGAFCALGAFVPGKEKTLDLLAAAKTKGAAGMEQKKKGLPWAVPAVFGGLVLAAFIALTATNLGLQRQIDDVRAFTEDAENLAIVEQVNQDRAAAAEYGAARQQAEDAAAALAATRQPEDAMLTRAESAAAGVVSFTGYRYDAENRALTLTCQVGDYREIPDFIARMQATGDYDAVDYSSYTDNGSGAGGYVFTVVCTVKEAQ